MRHAQAVVLPTLPLQEGGSLSRIVFVLTTLFLWSLVLLGPLRYGFALLHLDVLIYLPKLLLLTAVFLLPLLRPRASAPVLTVSTFAVLYLVWGTVDLPSPGQAVFGVWVLTPLLFGLWAGAVARPEEWRTLFVVLFIVAALGVLLNPLVHYPWSGQSLDVLGNTIEVSRQWTVYGVDRYAGFARASFNAAAQLLLFGVMLVALLKRRSAKLLIWLVAGAGMALTTSKGPLGAWLVLSMYFAGGALLRWPKYWIQLWLGVVTFILLVMILLPLSTLWIHYDPTLHGYVNKLLFASFGMRLNWTWPTSLHLLDLGGVYHWWVGRGLGGIGAAQQYFEPVRYLPGDNFFVYVAVIVGLPASLLLFITLWWRIVRISLRRDAVAWRLPMILAIIAYGVVSTNIENTLFAFFLGMALSAQSSDNRSSFVS